MMDKEFIPYQEALELKELDFDEPCLYYYYGSKDLQPPIIKDSVPQWINHNDSILATCYSAPTFSQAFRFFRKKYNLDSEIYMNHEYGSKFYTYLVLQLDRAIISHLSGATGKSLEHEEAELECLRKLIEIVKKKENKV